ncbi:hypothetical protein QMG83_01035 [Salinibacterium sp. G-O1]|uniref:hypothetical protein n=1 Tax=Salinibacterium sp. G-O1 TaxID=3046208 RepID=UPI0024B90BCA|nr:hypothetical protein [Salinibacterium sp. G-O1]MDJ0333800.1 hypothetical protein [Salinibacterium sp. G-O1]
MTSGPETIGLLAEVFTIVGFSCAALCFVILCCMLLVRGPWQAAPAAISGDSLNWLTPAGDVRSRPLTDTELALAHDHDSLEVFHRRRSSHCHFTRSSPDEKLLRTLGIVFAGIGALAVVASVVVLFVP